MLQPRKTRILDKHWLLLPSFIIEVWISESMLKNSLGENIEYVKDKYLEKILVDKIFREDTSGQSAQELKTTLTRFTREEKKRKVYYQALLLNLKPSRNFKIGGEVLWNCGELNP